MSAFVAVALLGAAFVLGAQLMAWALAVPGLIYAALRGRRRAARKSRAKKR